MQARARDSSGTHADNLARGQIQNGHTIRRIHRWSIVLIAQTEIQREAPRDFPVILHIGVICGRAQRLRIIGLRLQAERRKSEQEIADPRSGNNAEEGKRSARVVIQNRVQLRVADFAADFQAVAAADQLQSIANLPSVAVPR